MPRSKIIPFWIILGLLLALGLVMGSTALAQAAAPAQSALEGKVLFQQQCMACHTIGGGVRVGPDLQDVTQRRDQAWLKQFIKDPAAMVASGDPTATGLLQEYNNLAMPTLGLSDTQTESLIIFLENPQAAGPLEEQAPLTGGGARSGESLFSGAVALSGGGTSCIACHSVAGVGPLGGGSLGPDLTHVYTRYGEAGLASALGSLPFPTMQGIFANRPLTLGEQADLAAYFKEADLSPAAGIPPSSGLFWGLGVIGAILFFGFMTFGWPEQRSSISQQLRQKNRVGQKPRA